MLPPNGAMYTEHSALMFQHTTLLTSCIPFSVLIATTETETATAEPAGRSRREARARIQTAATPCFTTTESAPTGVERLTEHAHVSKRTFYPHFSG